MLRGTERMLWKLAGVLVSAVCAAFMLWLLVTIVFGIVKLI